MKKFVLQFIFFFIPIVLFAYVADVFISTNLKKSNEFVKGEYSTWNALYDKKVNSKILILGSSRAWTHLDAKMIGDSLKTSAYNLGMDGYTFWFQNYRRKLALRENPNPKLIIQSIDVFTLYNRKDLFYPEQFLPYMLGNKELEKTSENYIGYTKYDYRIPLLRYFGKGKSIIEAFRMACNAKNPLTRIKGFQGQEKLWNNDLENAKSKMSSFSVKADSLSLSTFENYLIDCKKNNIKIVFVYSPEYIEGQNFIKNRKEMIQIYTNWSKKYNIPFFDYSNDSISYQKKYFYNAMHMNIFGAELFTTKFIKDLKSLNIKYE